MIYREGIERICREMRERKKDLEEEMKLLPEGSLYINEKNGTRCYYNRLAKKGNRKKERRIGIKKDPERLNALTRKKYLLEAINRLEGNIKAVSEMLRNYVPADENSVMDNFISVYPELSAGVYYGVRDAGEWARAWKGQSDFHRENLTSIAADGTLRRSKGEMFIGAKLDHYRIPYRYEELAHPDLPYRPDFMIMRPRDGKIIFWEHLGLVNDEEYMKRNRTKLSLYEEAGIVPWDNLIVTYDQADGGINEKLIDGLIHGWLL